jgi:hypothetical protein
MNIKKWLSLNFRVAGFVSLCVLQALAFVCSFCGIIVHQMQRMSAAHVARVHALSNRSLIKALCPTIISALNEIGMDGIKDPINLRIEDDVDPIRFVIKQIGVFGREMVFMVEVVGEEDKVKSRAYLLLAKSDGKNDWCYRGIQFGSSL